MNPPQGDGCRTGMTNPPQGDGCRTGIANTPQGDGCRAGIEQEAFRPEVPVSVVASPFPVEIITRLQNIIRYRS